MSYYCIEQMLLMEDSEVIAAREHRRQALQTYFFAGDSVVIELYATMCSIFNVNSLLFL